MRIRIELTFVEHLPFIHSGGFTYVNILILKNDLPGTFRVVQWLRLQYPLEGMWFRSPVREIRSHMPCGVAKKKKKKIDPPPGVKDFVTGPILQMGKTEAERGEFWPQNHTDCKWGDCNAVVGFPREEMKTSPGRVYVGQACRPSLAQQQDLNTDLACPFFHQPPQRADLV